MASAASITGAAVRSSVLRNGERPAFNSLWFPSRAFPTSPAHFSIDVRAPRAQGQAKLRLPALGAEEMGVRSCLPGGEAHSCDSG